MRVTRRRCSFLFCGASFLSFVGFGSEVAYLGYDSDEEGDRKDTARVDTGEYRIIHKDKNQQFKSKEEYEKYIGKSHTPRELPRRPYTIRACTYSYLGRECRASLTSI